MSQWLDFSNSDEKWRQHLLQLKIENVFQSVGWSNYKKVQGSTVYRVASSKMACQFIVYQLPMGITLLWAPGGPLFSSAATNDEIQSQLQDLKTHLQKCFSKVSVRISSHETWTPERSAVMSRFFHRPKVLLGSGKSTVLATLDNEENFKKSLNSKHRYYIKQAQKTSWIWQYGHSTSEIENFLKLHDEMTKQKSLQHLKLNPADFKNLLQSFDGQWSILTGIADGQAMTTCLVLKTSQQAFYYLAATSLEGRKVSAAYAMVNELINQLRREGIPYLDFGGIDSENSELQGVNHFKLGFGGTQKTYLGEWEFASSTTLRYLANLAYWWRKD